MIRKRPKKQILPLRAHNQNIHINYFLLWFPALRNQNELISLMKRAIGKEHFHNKVLNDCIIKIKFWNDYAYRVLNAEIIKCIILWQSYEQKRDIIVMKNVHYFFLPGNVTSSISVKELNALNTTPKLKWKTEKPLHMVLVI